MSDSGPAFPSDDREAKRRLRQQRQNMRNLAASLAVSLAIVAFLIFIIPRPGGNQVPSIEWREVAVSLQDSAPGELLVPRLDDTWRGNRADVREVAGTIEWTVGLLGSGNEFVLVVQGFGAGDGWVSDQVRGHSASDTTELGIDKPVVWQVYDRSGVTDPGNRVWAVSAETVDGHVVVAGLTRETVFLVASDLATHHPDSFAGN